MTLVTVETNYTAAATLTAWPSGLTTNSVALTESPAGLFKGTLDDAYANIWYAFAGTSAPTTWDSANASGPKRVFDLAQIRLSSSGTIVTVTQPVSTDGNLIYPIVIGDDYLVANARSFTWDIPAITGFSVGTATCRFGGSYTGDGVTHTWTVTGTITDLGTGYWRLSFDVPKTTTQDLPAAYYVWSVEVRSAGGTEITRVRSGRLVQLVEKQT